MEVSTVAPSSAAARGFQIQGGGHQQEAHLRPQHLPGLAEQSQGQIQIGPALMHLIEHHQGPALQGGIGLKHPQKHPRGHHQQPGAGAATALQANAVAHLFPHGFCKGLSQALGGGSGRQAARLDQENLVGWVQGLQNGEGNPGGFASPWRSLQDHGGARWPQSRHDGSQLPIDGERHGLGKRRRQSSQRTWRMPSTGWYTSPVVSS